MHLCHCHILSVLDPHFIILMLVILVYLFELFLQLVLTAYDFLLLMHQSIAVIHDLLARDCLLCVHLLEQITAKILSFLLIDL